MKKHTLLAAVVAATLGLVPSLSQAQSTATTSSGSLSSSSAGAISQGIGTLVIPGAGPVSAAGPQTLYTQQSGTVWTMGQTTGGNSVTSYDACLKNAQLTVLFAAIAIPLEIAHCWALRDMDAMAKFPPGSIQYEHGCRDSAWLQTDWDSGTLKCTANQAKLRKSNPNDPRVAPFVATPVVSTNMGPAVPVSVSPTVVPVTPTNVSQQVIGKETLPRCKGPNDQSRCFSG